MKLYQPSLFATPITLYNRAVSYLVDFDTENDLKMFRDYSQTIKDCDLAGEYALVAFLDDLAVRNALESDPEIAIMLWNEWERANRHLFGENVYSNTSALLLSRIRKAYFLKISNLILSKDNFPYSLTIPQHTGLRCFILADRFRKGLEVYERCLERAEKPGTMLGYVAECQYHCGLASAARNAFLQACLCQPYEIDSTLISDQAVRDLLEAPETICDEYDIPPGEWRSSRDWAAALGIITGIFNVDMGRLIHPAASPEKIFHSLTDDTNAECSTISSRMSENIDSSPGRLFAAGMILSWSQTFAEQGSRSNSDTVSIRQKIKEISPQLFSITLNRLS